MSAETLLSIVEVDSREADGLLVTLSYDKSTEIAYVGIFDSKTDFMHTLPVPAKDAYNAYQHPFAYLASQHVDYPLPNRQH
jgi:hypothetical protein